MGCAISKHVWFAEPRHSVAVGESNIRVFISPLLPDCVARDMQRHRDDPVAAVVAGATQDQVKFSHRRCLDGRHAVAALPRPLHVLRWC